MREAVFRLHEVPEDWLDDPFQNDDQEPFRWPTWPSLPQRFKVPARSEVHGRGRIASFFIFILKFLILPFRFVLRVLGKAATAAGKSFLKIFKKRGEASPAPAVIGYIPIEIFISLCIITFGIYPYIWLWSNSRAMVQLCGSRVRRGLLRRFAASGFCAQLMAPLLAAAYIAWRFTGIERIMDIGLKCLVAYALIYALVIFPQRTYCYFALRWSIRNAVAAWDREEIMIARTMTSWLKLFLLGSAYIQLHSNRLIGLGMPGFADQDEILPDFSLGKWMREYVITKKPAPDIIRELPEGEDV
ncbi:MAG: DUF4234 domain-containing protein [Synergistaceae bacterium]|nr:DUF4234 domain-containing protein [Synergistaceae bacterium]